MEANRRVGDYEILGELGQGGMGRVYRVRNVISDRVEAMKVLLPDLAGRQDLAGRFLREIKLLAALDHPNIASLRTALTADNQLVMIMEFVEGQSLAERLRRGPIPIADALHYIEQGLVALSYAHAQHVVHRDIKPANMMLTPDGVVKLMDFGIARQRDDTTLTVAGTTTGSLSYMSPEQVNGEKTDARSDLYSMGISLYELVTGQRPFRADSDFAVMVAHLKEAPRPPIELKPALGAALNDIIMKSIAKDPSARFQTADELRAALLEIDTADATVILGSGAGAARPSAAGMAAPPAAEQAPTVVTPNPVPVMPKPTAASPPPPVVPPAPTLPPPIVKTGHPAMFVALGALLVIGALVVAGLYIGRADAEPGKTDSLSGAAPAPSASESPSSATPAPSPVPAEPAPAPTAAAASAPTPAGGTGAAAGNALTSTAGVSMAPSTGRATPAGAGAKSGNAPAKAAPAAALPVASGARAQSASTASSDAALDELDSEVEQLLTRASAVNQSLDTLRQQQARTGLGLRGDIVGRQDAMNVNLTRARDAIRERNLTRAQRSKALAEGDIEALERFLGR